MSRPRLHDDGYLAFLRTKPCCICGRENETEACHIRIGFLALNKKPDDRFAVPMCSMHHRHQHGMNEADFWDDYVFVLAPFEIAAKLYEEYGGMGGRPRKRKAIKPRKPKAQRAKIRSRGFPKAKRRMSHGR